MRLTPHHVGLIISDLERSKRFYEALGFELDTQRSDDAKALAFMRLGSFELELFCYHETPPACVHDEKRLGFRHLALRTDDLDGDLAALQAAGWVDVDAEIKEVPGLARLLFFPDPDGIEIEIMQPL